MLTRKVNVLLLALVIAACSMACGSGLRVTGIQLGRSVNADSTVANHTTLVGWSPGGGARDPGSIVISSSLPIVTQPDLFPLSLDAAARPVTGTSVTVTTSQIPAGTPLGAAVFSLTRHNPGVSLAPLGMPNCFQYVGLDFANAFVPSGATGTFAFAVPNNAGLAGLRFFCQSATFSAGVNPLGVLASNGLDFLVGTR